MKKGKLDFENLVIYGEAQTEVNPYFLFIEPLKWNKEKHKGHVKSHLHSALFQISIVVSGNIFFKSETIQKIVTEPTVILIPEDNLHSFKFEEPTKGWTVTISQKMIDELLEKYPQAIPNFASVKLIDHLTDNPKFEIINMLCEKIQITKEETGLRDWIFNSSTIGLIVYYINEICAEKGMALFYKKESKEYIHLRKFKKLIRENIDARKKVSDYAFKLGITTTHLNRLCNSLTGNSASQTIYDSIVLEAKKYLKYSTFSVSEIAYILNFKSPSHFSKFFKNQTKISPKFYRVENRKDEV